MSRPIDAPLALPAPLARLAQLGCGSCVHRAIPVRFAP
jgi:hypothetical protein